LPSESGVLKSPESTFRIGQYSYKIFRDGGQELYSVSDSVNTISNPLEWAFGSGSRGQSYLFRYGGNLYEARISFFRDRGFNISPDHPDTPSKTLELALGRVIDRKEEVACFGCHTVASSTNGRFEPGQLMPGISCEGCHGPGAAHVAIAKAGANVPGLIYNPARLSAAQSVDFCGACHRTWWDASLFSGIRTVRFPAFRLESSRCWGNGDKRLTCAACHNPHRPLQHIASAYDTNCLSCHRLKATASMQVSPTSSGQPTKGQPLAPACPTGTSRCVTCHMPKYEIPSMRTIFTDHKIQVVRGKTFRE